MTRKALGAIACCFQPGDGGDCSCLPHPDPVGPLSTPPSQDIGFPHSPNGTVSSVVLFVLCALVPIIILIAYKCVIEAKRRAPYPTLPPLSPLFAPSRRACPFLHSHTHPPPPRSLYVWRRTENDPRRLWLMLYQFLLFGFALVINGIVTDTLKSMVGRLRPDFLSRCMPDYSLAPPGSINNATGYVAAWANVCTGDEHIIIEGRKSFPSGHSSYIMTGMVFLFWFFWRAMRSSTHGSVFLRPLLQAICINTGLVVAASRVW